MNRREALSRVAILLGGTIVGGNIFLQTGCNTNDKDVSKQLTHDQVAYLDEVAETILPKTGSPGAKEAGVGAFMAVMVRDCYTPADQKIFIKGLDQLEDACEKMNGKGFMKCSPAERTKLLIQLDNENKTYTDVERKRLEEQRRIGLPKTNLYEENNKITETRHYFRMMKELTLLGFFTSEKGATQALRHIESPGHYDGALPYKKGDRAWATS